MEAQNFLISYFSQEDLDHQSTESGALIGSNDDLLTEILLWLPVTSIIRFKSVSKHWRWLLSHSRFTLLYDNHNLSPSRGLFVHQVYSMFGVENRSTLYIPFDVENPSTPPLPSLDFCFDPCGIKIVQSCNGLLLCCSDGRNKRTRKYYVYNPTTKQIAIIPSFPGGQDVSETICFMGLAFHQRECVHYKVVCIRCLDRDVVLQIQIYSYSTRKWKISVKTFFAQPSIFSKGVYWNGAIHWLPVSLSHVYFKIEDGQVQTLPLPVKMVSSGAWANYFGESRGHLHLIITGYHGENCLPLNVYEMLSDHSGWFVKYQVDLNEISGAFPEIIDPWCYVFNVLDVVIGEKEEDAFMVLVIPGNMITYNLHGKSFKHISNFPLAVYEGHTKVNRYIETLASF